MQGRNGDGSRKLGRGGKKYAIKIFPLVFLLFLWETAGWLKLLNDSFLPPPSAILAEFVRLTNSGILVTNFLGSILRVTVGFGIAVSLGVAVGIILGLVPSFGAAITPIIELIRPIPPIAWIPIAILWFGLGNRSAVFIIFIGAFFPIFVNTYAGMKSISHYYINTALSFGAGKRLILTDIILPAAAPQILIGIRVGIGTAWMSVIASEMVGTHEGLGYAIQLGRIMLDTKAVIVNMILIGLVGWLMNRFVLWLERRLIGWNLNQIVE